MATQNRERSERDAPPEGILEAPDERVLSTMNEDGSRRWLRPRPSKGRFLRRRQIFGYFLILLFTVLPYITINGKPAVLLDIAHRKFSLFGTTFLATDTLFLMLAVVSVFVTIFLLTALFGRVWCGWGCPQTVYLELVYRPLERFFEGYPGRRLPESQRWRRFLKWPTYFLLSMFLAHTFLAYFVGIDQLRSWVLRSPFEHPLSFSIMVLVTVAMLFDFGWFREQTCLVVCPYGRFQSALLDRWSLIVGYDHRRGEPRGRGKTREKETGPSLGDCVDCYRCVATCPTGIDIRDGLQLECVHCTQCIDACDEVMEKIGKPRGLIRYGSQSEFDGEPRRILRPRVIIYPLILTGVVTTLIFNLATKAPADVTVLRQPRTTFAVLEDGRVTNRLHVKIVNRTDDPQRYTIAASGAPGLEIQNPPGSVLVESGETQKVGIVVACDASAFANGPHPIEVTVTTPDGTELAQTYKLVGPRGSTPNGDQP